MRACVRVRPHCAGVEGSQGRGPCAAVCAHAGTVGWQDTRGWLTAKQRGAWPASPHCGGTCKAHARPSTRLSPLHPSPPGARRPGHPLQGRPGAHRRADLQVHYEALRVRPVGNEGGRRGLCLRRAGARQRAQARACRGSAEGDGALRTTSDTPLPLCFSLAHPHAPTASVTPHAVTGPTHPPPGTPPR